MVKGSNGHLHALRDSAPVVFKAPIIFLKNKFQFC